MDFLTNRPQHVKMGTSTSSSIVLNTGVPQGCVLSPVLYTPCTHDCLSNTLIKFAHDTTIVGQISNITETFYREEIQTLTALCSDSHLNTKKTKQIMIDFWWVRRAPHSALTINREEVERVTIFRFLELQISEDLGWIQNTTYIIKIQQPLVFPRMLKRNKLPPPLKNFYRCTIESVLTYGCTAWLQQVIKMAK